MTQSVASIGIDVGGTKLLAGLVDADGQVLQVRRNDTRPGHLLDDMVDGAAWAAKQARDRDIAIVGIGVGLKGFVDAKAGRLVRSISLGLRDVPIADTLAKRFRLPCWLENDVHASALGELEFGLGRAHKDFIVFNAGTGISAGLIIDGRLHVGAGGMAGEIGHMAVLAGSGLRCACGRVGCLEDLIHRSRRGEAISLPSDARYGDMDVSYRLLAIGLANLVNAFNPSAIACVGGMLLNDTPAIAELAEVVRKLCLQSASDSLRQVVPAFGGYQAGLIGAGALPFLKSASRLPRSSNFGTLHVET